MKFRGFKKKPVTTTNLHDGIFILRCYKRILRNCDCHHYVNRKKEIINKNIDIEFSVVLLSGKILFHLKKIVCYYFQICTFDNIGIYFLDREYSLHQFLRRVTKSQSF